MSSASGWKSRIKSTIHTNSRIDALLKDSKRPSITALIRQRKSDRSIGETSEKVEHEETPHQNFIEKWNSITKSFERIVNVEEIKRTIGTVTQEQFEREIFFRTYNPQISSKFCQILSRKLLEKIKETTQTR